MSRRILSATKGPTSTEMEVNAEETGPRGVEFCFKAR